MRDTPLIVHKTAFTCFKPAIHPSLLPPSGPAAIQKTGRHFLERKPPVQLPDAGGQVLAQPQGDGGIQAWGVVFLPLP